MFTKHVNDWVLEAVDRQPHKGMRVELPGDRAIYFPEGTSEAEMNKVIAENFSVAKPPEGIVFVAEKLSAPMEPPMWQTIIAGLLASTLGFSLVHRRLQKIPMLLSRI